MSGGDIMNSVHASACGRPEPRSESSSASDSERWLDLIRHGLDGLPHTSVMLFNEEMRYLLVRGQALNDSEFRSHELEGQLASETLSSSRWSFYEPLYRRALLGVVTTTNVSAPSGGGDFVVRVGPVRDDSGVVVGGIAMATDETERLRDLHRLKESEERFRLLAENTSDFVVRLSPNGVVEWVSPSISDITGWQPMEIVGRHVLNFAHPDDQEDVKAFAGRLRDGFLRSGRSRVRTADGSFRWFSRIIRPIHDDDGAVEAFVSSWRDVESEVLAERLLVDSEQQLRQAMETSSIGMMMTASDGRFLTVNEALCAMLGYSRAELEAMTFFDVTHPDDVSAGAQGIRDLATGAIRSFKQRKRYIGKLGEIVWVDLSTAAIFDSDGVFRHTVTQVVDVTTEVLNYEALQRSARQFRLLAENSSDVVYQTDLNGMIEWVSPSVSHVLGWDPELLVGVPSVTLLHPDDVPKARELRARMARGEGTPPMVIRYRSSVGSMREMSAIKKQIHARDGTVTGVSVSLRDVTEEQVARRELARSEEQFRLAMANAPHGMVITDSFGVMLQVNRALLDLLGVTEADVVGRLLSGLIQEEARSTYDAQMRELLSADRDSVREERVLIAGESELWVDHATSLQRDVDTRPIFFVHQFADQTAAREASARHEWLAHHDELTFVQNRRGGNALLSWALESAAVDSEKHGLLFVDIDKFKDFNTLGGEEAGDAVLVAVARALIAVSGSPADVVRWGGDEFLVLVRNVDDEAELVAVAEQILDEVSKPVDVGSGLHDGAARITVSVIATLIKSDDTAKTLITRASEPLSSAKDQGRNRVTVQF